MNLRLSCQKTVAQGKPSMNGWGKKYLKDGTPNYGTSRKRTIRKAILKDGDSIIKDATINKCYPSALKTPILGMSERMVGQYHGKPVMRISQASNVWTTYNPSLFN